MGQAKARKAEIDEIKLTMHTTPEQRASWGLIADPSEQEMKEAMCKIEGDYQVISSTSTFTLGPKLSEMIPVLFGSKSAMESADNFAALADKVADNNSIEIANEYITYIGQRYAEELMRRTGNPKMAELVQVAFLRWCFRKGGVWRQTACKMTGM